MNVDKTFDMIAPYTHQVTCTVSPTFQTVELSGLVMGGVTTSRMTTGRDETADSKNVNAKTTMLSIMMGVMNVLEAMGRLVCLEPERTGYACLSNSNTL